MDELAEAIYQWSERNKRGICITATILGLAAILLNEALENGLI